MAKVDMASGEVTPGEAGRDFIRDIVKATLALEASKRWQAPWGQRDHEGATEKETE